MSSFILEGEQFRIRTLSYSYRVPQNVMEIAKSLIDETAAEYEVDIPTPVRLFNERPKFIQTNSKDLIRIAAEEAF